MRESVRERVTERTCVCVFVHVSVCMGGKGAANQNARKREREGEGGTPYKQNGEESFFFEVRFMVYLCLGKE